MRSELEPELAALHQVVASGEAILFTGAGFSAGVRDRQGRPLPSSDELAGELWAMQFGDRPRDGSSLADLLDVALLDDRERVHAFLTERFTVGDAPLPRHVVAWLAAPWRRIYTVGVDDVEAAAMRNHRLPHELRTRSALEPAEEDPACPDGHCQPPPRVDVLHLGGVVGGALDEDALWPWRYGARRDGGPGGPQLVDDLAHAPFVFVGTTLDDGPLWQLVVHHRRRRPEGAPRSYLVARSLTAARALLLDSLGIEWLAVSAEQAAVALPGG